MHSADALWNHLRTMLSRLMDGARTPVPSCRAAVCSPLVPLHTRAGWRALLPGALPLLRYSVAYLISLYVAEVLDIALNPSLATPFPLYLTGAVTVSALLLAPPRRWWLYLVLTIPLLLFEARLFRIAPTALNMFNLFIAYTTVVFISVLTASLFRRFTQLPLRFASVSEVARFQMCVGVGVVPSTVITNSLRSALNFSNFWLNWQTTFLGYFLGIVVFLPPIVLGATDGLRGLHLTSPARRRELALLSLATLVMSVVVFATRLPDEDIAHTLIYLVVPPLIWAAIRFGSLGVSSALSLATLIGITSAIYNRGPFVGSSSMANVLSLQLFLACVGVPLLLLAALVQEQQAAHTEVARQSTQLDRIFEQMAEALVVYDAHGQIVRENMVMRRLRDASAAPPDFGAHSEPDRIALYALRDGQGRLLAPEEAPNRRALRGEVLTGEHAVDLQMRSLDGHEREMRMSAAPLRNPTGEIVGAVGTVLDMSEHNRLVREREQAQARELAAQDVARQLDQFFVVASHDIRGPATAVGGFVQLARAQAEALANVLATPGEPEAAHVRLRVMTLLRALATADESGQRLMRLVTVLFDVARARSGTLTVELALCDLVPLVREQVAAQREITPARTLQLELPDHPVFVLADADRLGQVVLNYLANAVKSSADDQPITVRLVPSESAARISVHDHGPGLPADELPRVWVPSYRTPGVAVQSSASAASGSLGMGLYICKSIVALHPGGQVGVESVEGAGSAFWFSLPLTSSTPYAAPDRNQFVTSVHRTDRLTRYDG